MRSHAPPTHVAYPTKRFILLSGREFGWLVIGLFLALNVANATASMTPSAPGTMAAYDQSARFYKGLAALEQRDDPAATPEVPADPPPLFRTPSSLPDDLAPYGGQIRLALAVVPFVVCTAAGLLDLPRLAKREIAFLLLPKDYAAGV